MSVELEAQRQLDRAREGVLVAIDALTQIVIVRCAGHDDFFEAFQDTMREALATLLDVRKELKA